MKGNRDSTLSLPEKSRRKSGSRLPRLAEAMVNHLISERFYQVGFDVQLATQRVMTELEELTRSPSPLVVSNSALSAVKQTQ